MPRFTQTQMAWQIEEGESNQGPRGPWENIGVCVLGGRAPRNRAMAQASGEWRKERNKVMSCLVLSAITVASPES